jgi:hypothetical protein
MDQRYEDGMSKLINQLRALNRKERLYLLAFALDNQRFRWAPTSEVSSNSASGNRSPAMPSLDYHLTAEEYRIEV